MSGYMPWREGERAARDAESRRGRLVGKDSAGVETFATGTAECASCKAQDDAGRMMRGASGLVCEGCYFAQEADVDPGQTWLLQAVGAVAPVLLGVALLLILAWAMAAAPPPTMGEGGPIHFPLLAGGLFGISGFFSWPMFRLVRSDAELHGLTPGLHRVLAGIGISSMIVSILGFVLSVILVLALLPPIPAS